MQSDMDVQQTNEVSIKELLLRIRKRVVYVISQWKIVLALFIIGGVIGYFYARSKDTLYQAQSIFVLDEGKSSGSAISGLALLGIGSGNASSGLFTSAKNIIWLYKSRLMLNETLMSNVNYKGKPKLLIDIFLDENGLRKQMNQSEALKGLTFKPGLLQDSMTNEQRSIMLSCVGLLKGSKYLEVTETENAENLITVDFKSRDEVFSKVFVETLVQKVNDFYVKTKTEKTKQEIDVLERKADSAKVLMNHSMYKVASAVEDVPYANPVKATLRVAPEQTKVDVEAVSAMYLELAKNLETRRMALAQETPLIQIVESPQSPLTVIKPAVTKMAIVTAFLFAFFTALILVAVNWYRGVMQNN